MLINPITKKNDIPVKAEVMVILEWEDSSEDDIDLWISGPGMQEPLSFQRKQSGMMHLDRDDLGSSTDVAIVDNITIKLKYNREIATMRGILAGEYYVNVHVYSKRDPQPTKFKITLMDVNPFQELYVLDGTSDETGQVIKFPAFIIDDSGKITKLFNSEKIVVRVMQQQATGASVR